MDHAVSVNTIAIWPDRDTGLDEFTRVVQPGARYTRIADGLVARCASVERTALSDVVVFPPDAVTTRATFCTSRQP